MRSEQTEPAASKFCHDVPTGSDQAFKLTDDDPFTSWGPGPLFSIHAGVVRESNRPGRGTRTLSEPCLDVMRSDELVVYLRLDRLKKPQNALQILMKNRGLPFFWIGGRLAFRKSLVDEWVAQGGDRQKKRGRPKGSRNKMKGRPLSSLG